MDPVFAPWRMDWVTREDATDDFDGCVFCALESAADDRKHRILARSEQSFVLLNRAPYTPGHLLVLPRTHTGHVTDLEEAELLSLFRLLQMSIDVVKQTLLPDGFNVGMNIGEAGGASIHDHLHVHIVPRWQGDTTFMPTTANTKIIAEALDETYDRLQEKFLRLEEAEIECKNGAVIVR